MLAKEPQEVHCSYLYGLKKMSALLHFEELRILPRMEVSVRDAAVEVAGEQAHSSSALTTKRKPGESTYSHGFEVTDYR